MEQIAEKENIWRQLDALPVEARREVLDFISFLQTRYQKANRKKSTKIVRLSDEPFVGIWKDREDLKDNVTWVRGIRKREWTSQTNSRLSLL